MKKGKEFSVTVWSAVALGAVGIGVIVAFLAGYFLGHFTGHEKTTTVSAVTSPAESGGENEEASSEEGEGGIEPAPAFTSDEISAEAGDDWITNGGGGTNHIYFISSKLTSADTVDGGNVGVLHFTDAAKLTDASFAGLTKNITNIETLDLDNAAKGQTFVAGDNFGAFVTKSGLQDVTGTSSNPASSFTFDFSKYGGPAVEVYGGAGNDVFKGGTVGQVYDGGSGDDSFQFSAANFAGRREVADARGLLGAALDARDPAAAAPVLEWMSTYGVQSVALQALRGKVEALR